MENSISRSKDLRMRFVKNKMAVLGLLILALLVIMAIFAPVIATHVPEKQDLANRLALPSAAHFFGTDNFGRDIFSNVVYGARISLFIGLAATTISVVIGTIIGAVAGFFGGQVDNVIMRIVDVFLSIPSLILAIAISAVLGNGIRNLILAVSLSGITGYARIVRASVLSVKEQEYVEAAQIGGAGNLRLIFRHILPNCTGPIIVQATLGVGTAILQAASLSFIGLGVQPPTPEWGGMLSAGRDYIRDFPHLTLFPGLAIALTIFSLNLFGDGLRDTLDPKERS
ncbi:Glutathione transport system permease protein gsiD [Aedoeadaptatus ivorii]|uniref:Glutathione transport system permease protein gsiD n=1 Tax=Aedoeadaptatus ivorii TaxID=54006 RepID=A0A3S4Z387_9FIRM|nr:nickel transporter permease [Peptoniphilus ivorii]MDQ0508051.1 peptide/nickel transport system permease protein [Peptoniphilus ivorii]VEJ34961.1 Glutathione transport system permease protein gsiD [Peptoniphilus ivorii]